MTSPLPSSLPSSFTSFVTTKAAAFSLAAIATLTLLAGIDGLATTPSQDALFASVPAAQEQVVVQQVVITGQRLPRT